MKQKSSPTDRSSGSSPPARASARTSRPARPGPSGPSRAHAAAAETAAADRARAGADSFERTLTLAMPRGRILDEALELFDAAGIDMTPVREAKKTRRLIIPVPAERLRVLIVRDTDVPSYVEHGAADFGIAGGDVLDEQGRDLYEPVDLGIGRCRMSVAEPADRPVDPAAHIHLRYATKFPEITRRHLQSRGTVAEIIKLYGSIEIAPLVGLADRIVDLVSSGETLRQHNLVEVETIMEVSARLCVGRASAKLASGRIDDIVRRLEKAARRVA